MSSTDSSLRPGARPDRGAFVTFRRPSAHLIALLGVSLLFGGGGVGSGAQNLVVQLFALLLLAGNLPAVLDFTRSSPIGLRILAAASVALPLTQLIPLPPSVWHMLPGRGLVVESLELVAASEQWRPLTVNVMRTFVAFLGTIPPLTALVLTWKARGRDLDSALIAIVIMALAVMLLAMIQLSSGDNVAMIQPESAGGRDLFGTFANRNSSGLFLVLSLICLMGLPRHSSGLLAARSIWIVIAFLLAVGVILSHSRSSIALLIIPGGFAALAFARKLRGNWPSRNKWPLGVAMVGLFAFFGLLGIAASGNERLERAVSRFEDLQDLRPSIWEDSLGATRRFWPIGSGIGTFDEVFQVDESVETLDPLRAGRAHNDYLEVVLESGAAGALLALGWLVWVARLSILILIRRKSGQPLAAALGLAALALQSVLDYPLRNLALMCIAATLVGMLAAHNSGGGEADAQEPLG